ncbi:MAG TPA: hypothetical protein ENJ94_03940 [Gammaproteobacteria bacterium]|nr:hypothetical protein [Gammaproteobacteria bacterium]
MTERYERHARKIVQDFLDLLEPAARDCLPQEHLTELEMMIESAISTSVLGQLEAVADQISDLAVEVRRRAEHWQD